MGLERQVGYVRFKCVTSNGQHNARQGRLVGAQSVSPCVVVSDTVRDLRGKFSIQRGGDIAAGGGLERLEI